MLTNQVNFPFAAKAFFEFKLVQAYTLAQKALLAGEQFNALNTATAKTSIAEFIDAAQQLLSAKDPQALLAIASTQAQANADKATSYGVHLRGLISAIQTDFIPATEAHINAVAILKSVIRNAHAGYQQPGNGTKPALEQIAFDAVKDTDQLSRAVEAASNIA